MLHDEFGGLRASRESEDERIVTLLEGFGEEDLAKDCRFTFFSEPGERVMKPRLILATVFNHQTHHRGQVHAMLKEAGAEPPALDLINYPAALG